MIVILYQQYNRMQNIKHKTQLLNLLFKFFLMSPLREERFLVNILYFDLCRACKNFIHNSYIIFWFKFNLSFMLNFYIVSIAHYKK